MAFINKCPLCGTIMKTTDPRCPSCGAVNERYVADAPHTVSRPKTIEELREYCAKRGMPLQRMRFFIGENYREPKAFGIYRDGDEVVVYKNKANGERAIRYRGNDEAFGVNELFQKLLDECHNRGIYPDGKPAAGNTVSRSGVGSSGSRQTGSRSSDVKAKVVILCFIGILFAIFILCIAVPNVKVLVRQFRVGYYDFGDGCLYYKAASSRSSTSVRWFYTPDDDPSGTWYERSTDFTLRDGSKPERTASFFLGPKYKEEWGFSAYEWDRDYSNRSGYYSFNDEALFYLESVDDEKDLFDSFARHFALYMTGEDRPDGSWCKLGYIDNDLHTFLEMEDGSHLYFEKSSWNGGSNYLGRDYREEWGFSPVQIPELSPGYYDFGDGRLYYCDSRVWNTGAHIWYYASADSSSSSADPWHRLSSEGLITLSDGSYICSEDFSTCYLGTDWEPDWGGPDFGTSSYSRDSSSSSSSSSSSGWDSWDSDDTDWDSDW